MSRTAANTCSPFCTCMLTPIAFSADHPPVFAAAMHKLHSGGIDRASRGICVVSVVTAEPTATKNSDW